jgi:hypothetical protein
VGTSAERRPVAGRRGSLERLLITALRASGGSGAHAEAARHVVLCILLAQALAASAHDGPPAASARRAPRADRPRRARQPHHDSLSGRRPRG